ncbi:unnamed protein product [Bemisia tabaci]|uniref:Uncharacterized protein n=2 Tax=Bemisia tabaci TaxID=7038 RepID=A0A9P0CBY6_BEMTA|nr:unnamed protein product [Bemisia tabaci]
MINAPYIKKGNSRSRLVVLVSLAEKQTLVLLDISLLTMYVSGWSVLTLVVAALVTVGAFPTDTTTTAENASGTRSNNVNTPNGTGYNAMNSSESSNTSYSNNDNTNTSSRDNSSSMNVITSGSGAISQGGAAPYMYNRNNGDTKTTYVSPGVGGNGGYTGNGGNGGNGGIGGIGGYGK